MQVTVEAPDLSKYICYGDRSANDFQTPIFDAITKEAAENPEAYFDKAA